MSLKYLIRYLFDIGAIKIGSFKLKSGIISPIYIDLRVIISHPDVLRTIAELMWDKIKKLEFDLICGVPYTALPIATTISIQQNKPMLMRRKEAKEYGTKKMIEGIYEREQKCIIVEDLVTTGESAAEVANALRNEDLQVCDIIVFLDREQGASNLLKEKYKLNLHSIITMSELLKISQEERMLSVETIEDIRKFLQINQFKTD